MATTTSPTTSTGTASSVPAPKVGADEAEQVAKEFVAKKFNLIDPQVITVAYNASYSTFIVSVMGEKHRHKVDTNGPEEPQHHSASEAPESDKTPRESHTVAQSRFSYDVTVDKTGAVLAWQRLVRTSVEAEAIAKEYALERHQLTHFMPYTTTFDGTYYTVYAGGLSLHYVGGVIRSAHEIYKSKFYDVKVDRSGIVVGWTTEGLIAHYSAKLQRLR